jgi:hypothetical protein
MAYGCQLRHDLTGLLSEEIFVSLPVMDLPFKLISYAMYPADVFLSSAFSPGSFPALLALIPVLYD